MSIFSSKIIYISAVLSIVLQLVYTSLENDLNYKKNLSNMRSLQELDPKLQKNTPKATKNYTFEDPGYCSIQDPTKLHTLKPVDIVLPFNADLSLEESQRFTKYFQDEYIPDSLFLDSYKYEDYAVYDYYNITSNFIYLVKNEVDDYVTIILHKSNSKNLTRVKTFLMTKKQNIVKDEKWKYDFEIQDDFAFCYHCNNYDIKPQVCKIHLKAKTWGARNTIELTENLYVPLMETNELIVLTAKMEGGPLTMCSFLDILILCLYFCIPLCGYYMNLNYLNKTDCSKDRRLSRVGYCLSCCMTNSYHLYIFLSLGIHNITENLNVILIIISAFFIIGWCSAVFLYPTLANGDEKNGEPSLNFTFVLMHLCFYIITIPLVCTVFAPFVLYEVYMDPVMYFLLGNVYIIPIVISAAGRATVNDHYLTILLNGVYFGLFPLTKAGPGFWMDEYDTTWFYSFMSTQIIYAIIVGLQQTKGSRFFCPSKYRRYTYFRFKYDLDTSSSDESIYCSLCLNSIHDVELEYKDINDNYEYKDYGSDCYFKLKCDHIFHPNCLIRRTEKNDECPVCQLGLPPYSFDD